MKKKKRLFESCHGKAWREEEETCQEGTRHGKKVADLKATTMENLCSGQVLVARLFLLSL